MERKITDNRYYFGKTKDLAKLAVGDVFTHITDDEYQVVEVSKYSLIAEPVHLSEKDATGSHAAKYPHPDAIPVWRQDNDSRDPHATPDRAAMKKEIMDTLWKMLPRGSARHPVNLERYADAIISIVDAS